MSRLLEWRAIPGFEGIFEISNDGQIRSLVEKNARWGKRPAKTPWLRKLAMHPNGYYYIKLLNKSFKVHRLVLEAFVGPAPRGAVCCHNDGCKTNNRVENLRWGTRKENSADTVKHGTHPDSSGEKNGRSKLSASDVIKIRKDPRKVSEIAKDWGLGWSTVDDIKRRRKWRHVKDA